MNIHKYQLFWCELQGYYWFWHTAIFVYHIQSNIYGIQTNFPPYDPMLTSASAEAWTQFSLTPGHLGIDSGCKMLVSWWGEEYIGDYQLVNVGHVVWQFRGTPHIHTYSTYCIYIYTVIIYIYIIYIYILSTGFLTISLLKIQFRSPGWKRVDCVLHVTGGFQLQKLRESCVKQRDFFVYVFRRFATLLGL